MEENIFKKYSKNNSDFKRNSQKVLTIKVADQDL